MEQKCDDRRCWQRERERQRERSKKDDRPTTETQKMAEQQQIKTPIVATTTHNVYDVYMYIYRCVYLLQIHFIYFLMFLRNTL